MGIERRYKRQQEREVKKMYEREMRKMAKMTDEQKIIHLHHLSKNIKTAEPNAVEEIQPIDIDGI